MVNEILKLRLNDHLYIQRIKVNHQLRMGKLSLNLTATKRMTIIKAIETNRLVFLRTPQ